MIKELDTVVLSRDLPEYDLNSGDIGAVVHRYAKGSAYEVEFVTGGRRALEGYGYALKFDRLAAGVGARGNHRAAGIEDFVIVGIDESERVLALVVDRRVHEFTGLHDPTARIRAVGKHAEITVAVADVEEHGRAGIAVIDLPRVADPYQALPLVAVVAETAGRRRDRLCTVAAAGKQVATLAVLLVRDSSQWFLQTFHEPPQVGQPCA